MSEKRGLRDGACCVEGRKGCHLALQTRHMSRFLRESREIGPVLVEPLGLYCTAATRNRRRTTTTVAVAVVVVGMG